MPMVIPTPVTLGELADIAAPINVFDVSFGDREVYPRDRLTAVVSVVVTDDPNSPVSDNFTLTATAVGTTVTIAGSALGGEHIALAWDATGAIPVAQSASFNASQGSAEEVAIELAAFLNGNAVTSATVVGAVVTISFIAPATAVAFTAGSTFPGAKSAPVWVQEYAYGEWIRGNAKQGNRGQFALNDGFVNWVITPAVVV
jgi:hypothetical protein